MTIIWQKWQPIWHQLTHFQTKDNATPNLYLQTLNSSHRPIRKFIVVFKRLVFCIQCTPLQNPAEYLAAIWSLHTQKFQIVSLEFPLQGRIRLGENSSGKVTSYYFEHKWHFL